MKEQEERKQPMTKDKQTKSAKTWGIRDVLPRFKSPLPPIRTFFAERPEIWGAFGLSFGLMMIAYLVFEIWPIGERSVLCLDMNAQYVYYHIYMRDALFGPESMLYSWSRNFSGEFVGTIGYYLFSPFNLIAWVFPLSHFTEGLMLMIVTKIGMIGVTMAIYLSVWRKFSKHTTLIFSVMYALTSYNIVQTMNPMWLDGVMVFPLVIMGIEALLKDGKYRLLIFSLVYSFVTCFYIGYMIGIFAAIYFLYYALTSRKLNKVGNIKAVLKRSAMFASAAAISVLMSAFIILPVYASLSLGKFDFSVPDYTMRTAYDIFDMSRKFFLNSYDTVRMDGMPFLFAGTFALVMLPAYFLCGRIRRTRRLGGALLLVVLTLSMVITPVDMLWHGGQMPNWLPYRYSFMFGFLVLAFGAEAFQNIRKVSRHSLGIGALLFGTTLIYWMVADTQVTNLGNEEGGRNVFPFWETAIPAAIALVVFTVLIILVKNRVNKPLRFFSIILIGLVCFEMFFNTHSSLNGQHVDIHYSSRDSFRSMLITREITDELNRGMDERGEFYRMEKNFMRSANDPMALRMRGVTHSSSMLNANALHVMNGFGYASRSHSGRYWGATPLTDDLFAFRYILTADTAHHSSVHSRYDIEVHTNEDALPIAYLVNPRTREFELRNADVFGNQSRLLSNMLGEGDNPYFVRTHPHERRPENVTHRPIGEYSCYERVADGANAHIEYDFVAEASGEFFMYFPSNYERRTNLWIQRFDSQGNPFDAEFLRQMYETDHHHIQPLGWFDIGDKFMVTVSIPSEGDVMYFRDEIFMRLDHERLEADVARVHEMNVNTTFTAHSNTRLEITTNHAEDMLLFTSIPNEPGWRAFINGEPANLRGVVNWTQHIPAVLDDDGNIIEEARDVPQQGFLALNVPAGENTIELRFFPNMMPLGIALTFVGIAGFLLMTAVLGMAKAKEERQRSGLCSKADEQDSKPKSDSKRNKAVSEILEEIGIDMDDDDSGGSAVSGGGDDGVRDEYDGYDDDYVEKEIEFDLNGD
jgi:uncharacterized membrane protein YfhO